MGEVDVVVDVVVERGDLSSDDDNSSASARDMLTW